MVKTSVKIGITGCCGRMGQALLKIILKTDKCEFIGGSEYAASPHVGCPLKNPKTGDDLNLTVQADARNIFEAADVVIDFTAPEATMKHLELAKEYHTALIIGTTGLDTDQEKILDEAAEAVPMLYASNYSLGVNLLFYLTRQAAKLLDEDFDIEICETHHRHKVDAPSGTALSLGKEAASGRRVSLDDKRDSGRDGITGTRKKGDIGFAVLRGGNIAGEHTVSFIADDERIELTHKAGDRAIFAHGAVKAALWIKNQPAGLYDMSDFLKLPKE
jgi:4-hydroxy-tetrahydrodipicolinate reductase